MSLRTAMGQADLDLLELWLRYFALGGTASAQEVEAHVDGKRGSGFDGDGHLQHDTLVQALNERFMEMDLDHPLPYLRG